MINTSCSVCCDENTQLHRMLFAVRINPSETYQIRQCSHCSHVYSYFDHPVAIESYYDEKDYTVQDTKKTVFYTIQEREYKGVLKAIKTFTPLPATLLDFGSGKGLFLNFAKEEGFEVKGVESSVPRANYAKQHFGLDISTAYFKSGQIFNKKFDVLTMFHVLEHLHLADDLLKHLVKDNLRAGGLLVIEVPNFDSWQSRWAGNRWLHLDVPRHLSHFTPDTLKKVVEESGCQVKKDGYFSFHLGIIGMLQTILSWFGYKGFLIGDLKQKKKLSLLLGLAFALPFAFILETIAAVFNKGGVIRYYAIKEKEAVI